MMLDPAWGEGGKKEKEGKEITLAVKAAEERNNFQTTPKTSTVIGKNMESLYIILTLILLQHHHMKYGYA